ncbi:LysR family transcriptional regulator [Amycolatopsis sp. H20-H5]|uniref:LysR family transcriptional regulator n=1 Tax=Amycolatopsis sp. H20-H5 TaxID=3046309 RepID=UPI002DBE1935|nr:LysR family transcriptional regulator [Amycolatopsis sp. H20-H5]MEC3978520.1 LysR family transcriptional regulator [Amycolatopsis sp. H20-H5]
MEIRNLISFVEVTRRVGFTRAAEHLGYAQSSVTSHVHKLESGLGVQLFVRGRDGVALTEAGARLLPYAEKIISLSEEAEEMVGGGAHRRTRFVVGAVETLATYRMPDVLRQVRAKFPDLRLSVTFLRCEDAADAVDSGRVDMAVVLTAPLGHQQLRSERIAEERIVLVAAAGHPLATLPEVLPAHLRGEVVLVTSPNCSCWQVLRRELAPEPTPDHIELGTVEAVKRAVAQGGGLAVIAGVAVDAELRRGELVTLPWRPAVDVHSILVHRRTSISDAFRQVREEIVTVWRRQDAAEPLYVATGERGVSRPRRAGVPGAG